NAARASGSACGVRSPVRYGRKSTPSAPAGQEAASATRAAPPPPTTSRSQRREPAAESITPHPRQGPRPAGQNASQRARRSASYDGSTPTTTPDVPSATDSGPGLSMPTPSAPAA